MVCGGKITGDGKITSKGAKGGDAPGDSGGSEPDDLGGGGSGGGIVLVLHRGSDVFAGEISAKGGAGGKAQDFNGGSGGDGSILQEQI